MTAATRDVQAEARVWVADLLAAGRELSGREVGERFERSDRWGRDVLAAVRAEHAAAEMDRLPVVEPEALTAAVEVESAAAPEADGNQQVSAEGTHEVSTPDDEPEKGHPRQSGPAGHPGARLVAWLGFGFGTVISVAANVLHAWIPPEGAAEAWRPGLAPQLGAAVWPVALLLSVEVLSRVAWPAGWQWAAAKFGGVVAVAAGAAVISYGHIRDVLVHWGYGTAGAHVGPLVVDGLMIVCGFALLALSREIKPVVEAS
ncbi:DUF2637 domain-containing protein [Saccharomonospora cyanea]|uniref:DUF2637 domain-containing protein n=1 Tax=Saccharomonospora cyanea NA-134 TaxID=882082 RepID=H5XG60_9PSEU|nr:DUF2637 domain-containing protein [Saccharomonospora cyanea]EHR62642.1 Protein of unknown function (DUF2637) [Saccharomonospora cyanea NA-134]